MRAAFIVNPKSGRATRRAGGASRLELARDLTRAAGLPPDDVTIVATERPGHAVALARDFARQAVDRIVVWGGDGTINEAAGPVIGSGVVLGIVPGGSGDGLAHSLGVPRDVGAAVRVALTGPPRAVDVGYFADRHFLNVAGAGFDAAVAARFNRRRTRGVRGYIAECLTTVWSYRCAGYEVAAGGARWTGPRFLVAFANGREYGNGLVLVPNADPTDGQLDMVVVDEGPPLAQFWRARRLAWRRLAPAAGVHRARIAGATLEGKRMHCHVDGEPFEASGVVDVRIAPAALRVAGASG